MTEWVGPPYHGRPKGDEDEAATLLAAAEVTDGAMIALVPTEDDLDRIVIDGEPREQLHLTLAYLGKGADWSVEQQDAVARAMQSLPPGVVRGNVFGASYWNPQGPEPAWVLNVGGEELQTAHGAVWDKLLTLEAGVQAPALPEQHAPWVPHICLAYEDGSGETYDISTFTQMIGPITFDRLRLTFSGEVTDLPLDGGVIAAGASQGHPVTLPPSGDVQAALEEAAQRALRQGPGSPRLRQRSDRRRQEGNE